MAKLEITRLPAVEYACQEAINSLCTNLSFFGDEKRVIMFTSAKPSDGKSFVSLHVARTLARLGHRTVLLDADLRRSQVVSTYGLSVVEGKACGTTHYLAGKCELNDAIYETNIPDMHIMPVGRTVSNSLALLTTARFRSLMEHLRQQFEFIIVDAPPVGTIIDAAEIARSCDGTVMVIRYNAISRKEAVEAKEQIERMGCPVLGTVLNAVEFDSLSSKKYYNKSYYSYYANGYYKPTERKAFRDNGKKKP